jgi:hypothetical protein
MNDNFAIPDLVEHEIGVWRGRHPADSRIIRARADIRMHQQKVDDRLNTVLKARAPCGE